MSALLTGPRYGQAGLAIGAGALAGSTGICMSSMFTTGIGARTGTILAIRLAMHRHRRRVGMMTARTMRRRLPAGVTTWGLQWGKVLPPQRCSSRARLWPGRMRASRIEILTRTKDNRLQGLRRPVANLRVRSPFPNRSSRRMAPEFLAVPAVTMITATIAIQGPSAAHRAGLASPSSVAKAFDKVSSKLAQSFTG